MATENKNLSAIDFKSIGNARGKKITLVVAQWNKEITDGLKEGAINTLIELGVYNRDISIVEVPGSFELPFAANQVIKNKKADAIICIGSVIRGETSHFDFVCQGTTYGIQKLNVTQDVPVVFCVLTDNNITQSKDRSGGKHGNKGVEAAATAIQMIKVKEDLAK